MWHRARREVRSREQGKVACFERAILPHLDSAYNLARWLTRNDADAEDVAQEGVLRAFKFFEGFHGGDARAWLLAIVRNTCHTWLRRNRTPGPSVVFDEQTYGVSGEDPETILLEEADRQVLRQALEELPVEFREVVLLREFEELSYTEIAGIVGAPVGTVMSRLSRARRRLQLSLISCQGEV